MQTCCMTRPISRWAAFTIAAGFLIVGIVIGAFRVIPDDVRVAAIYPILLAGLVISLWDVSSNSSNPVGCRSATSSDGVSDCWLPFDGGSDEGACPSDPHFRFRCSCPGNRVHYRR